jgi:hypothetical protein
MIPLTVSGYNGRVGDEWYDTGSGSMSLGESFLAGAIIIGFGWLLKRYVQGKQ